MNKTLKEQLLDWIERQKEAKKRRKAERLQARARWYDQHQ